MFVDIVKVISLRNNASYIIVDEPIYKKEQDYEYYTFTTDCIDNWVIKDVADNNSKDKTHINKYR